MTYGEMNYHKNRLKEARSIINDLLSDDELYQGEFNLCDNAFEELEAVQELLFYIIKNIDKSMNRREV